MSSETEARWASSNAHRPGADRLCRPLNRDRKEAEHVGMCGFGAGRASAWLTHKGESQRAGSVGGGESPTLGNRTLRNGYMDRTLVVEVG